MKSLTDSAMEQHPPPGGWALPNPRGPMPVRRAPGVRRTCAVDITWPLGRQGMMVAHGTGRDICTVRRDQPPTVLAQDDLRMEIGPDGTVLSAASTPPRPALAQLVGTLRPSGLRKVLHALVSTGSLTPSPLYQLADDVPGTLVVAGWAWSRWPQFFFADEQGRRKAKLDRMEGVCTGFAPGSSALRTTGDYQEDRQSRVAPLPHPDDPQGWHALPEITGPSMRRARGIEVWIDGDIQVDSTFQDSATLPGGGRAAVHEYSVRATISRTSHVITRIEAVPHILPFVECPGALQHLQAVVGTPLKDLRERVLEMLSRTRGCTHLNDAVRALADVAHLAAALPPHSTPPLRRPS